MIYRQTDECLEFRKWEERSWSLPCVESFGVPVRARITVLLYMRSGITGKGKSIPVARARLCHSPKRGPRTRKAARLSGSAPPRPHIPKAAKTYALIV
jgi:hypothetical protein